MQDMEDSSTFGLEEEDNSRISGDEFELLDSADTNTFEQFVKDEDACSDIFSDCENPDEIELVWVIYGILYRMNVPYQCHR